MQVERFRHWAGTIGARKPTRGRRGEGWDKPRSSDWKSGSPAPIVSAMSEVAEHLPDFDDDEAAELTALAAAVEEARADPRGVPHAEMRAWLLEIAAGNFDAPPPEPRLL